MVRTRSESLPPAPVVRPRRNPRLLAVWLVAICLSGLGAAFLYTTLASSHQVLSLTRTIYRGEVVQAADLTTLTLHDTPGLSVVDASRISEVVGRTALVDMPSGTLLASGSVGAADVPAGTVRIGLRLAAGRLPVSALPAGTPVLLIAVSAANGQAVTGQASVEATVATAPVVQTDGSTLLDVTVPAAEAERVARLAAADQVALVRQAAG